MMIRYEMIRKALLPPFNFAIADMATGYESIFEFPMLLINNHLWDKVAISNDYITPKFPNFKIWVNFMILSCCGSQKWALVYMGVYDGLVLPHYSSWRRNDMERC